MPQITLDIPTAQANRVLDGFAAAKGYTGKDPQGNNETKQAFIKRILVDYIKAAVKTTESDSAILTARQTAEAAVESGITIT